MLTLTLRAPKPKPAGYPADPKTLGEHVKKARMDRGIFQKDLAADLGVSTRALAMWERDLGAILKPEIIPKLIAFLGFDPRPAGGTLGERVKRARLGMGLKQKELAASLGVDPTSVGRAEQGKRIGPKLKALLQNFLVEDSGDIGECGE